MLYQGWGGNRTPAPPIYSIIHKVMHKMWITKIVKYNDYQEKIAVHKIMHRFGRTLGR